MGEGYIGCHTYNRRGKTLLRAVAKIAVRKDDLPVLEAIQQRFGGHIFGREAMYVYGNRLVRNPSVSWQCVSKNELLEIGRVLTKTKLPAKKMKELPLWMKFVKLIPGKGIKYSEKQRETMLKIIDELKLMRKYKESTK